MEKIEKQIYYSNLFNIYKELISDTQREIMDAYFNFDLSISEISVERKISRAAVEDALQKGIKKLDEFEKSLQISTKKQQIFRKIENLKKRALNMDEVKEIEDIERNL